jgi:hypothetical protein
MDFQGKPATAIFPSLDRPINGQCSRPPLPPPLGGRRRWVAGLRLPAARLASGAVPRG